MNILDNIGRWWFKLFVPRYEIVDNGEGMMSSIRILSGRFKGLEYQYGKVSFGDDGTRLCWVYDVLNGHTALEKGTEAQLQRVQGDILRLVLETDLRNDAFLVG